MHSKYQGPMLRHRSHHVPPCRCRHLTHCRLCWSTGSPPPDGSTLQKQSRTMEVALCKVHPPKIIKNLHQSHGWSWMWNSTEGMPAIHCKNSWQRPSLALGDQCLILCAGRVGLRPGDRLAGNWYNIFEVLWTSGLASKHFLLIGLPLTTHTTSMMIPKCRLVHCSWGTCYWLFAIAIVICHWGGRICDHWSPGSPPWRARSCRHECARSPWRHSHQCQFWGSTSLRDGEGGWNKFLVSNNLVFYL